MWKLQTISAFWAVTLLFSLCFMVYFKCTLICIPFLKCDVAWACKLYPCMQVSGSKYSSFPLISDHRDHFQALCLGHLGKYGAPCHQTWQLLQFMTKRLVKTYPSPTINNEGRLFTKGYTLKGHQLAQGLFPSSWFLLWIAI